MPKKINLKVNGHIYECVVEPRLSLADCLRHHLGLTGTHVGCEHGVCGACTVLLDGASIRSCLLYAVQAEGHDIQTIEGVATNADELDQIQQTFRDHHALQCGFCTPGMIMTVKEIINEGIALSEEDIKDALSGNICRCTGYQPIVQAVTELIAKTNLGAKP
jgi:aerobic carbon-monoxide dehydrogenase small subunit